MNTMLSDLLAVLGEHFYLILIACIELVFAVYLLSTAPRGSPVSAKPP